MKRREILAILIPSFIFVLAWIGFSIYHNIVTTTISQPLSVQITPINPDFDLTTINSLKNRESITPLYQLSVGTQNLPTPTPGQASNSAVITPNPTPTPTVTPTPIVSPINNASSGGTTLP